MLRIIPGLLLAMLMLSLSAGAAAAAPVRVMPAAAWVHLPAFGLTGAEVAERPEFVLLDGGGRPITSGGLTVADIREPSYRGWWIARAQTADPTTRGIFIDDVAMQRPSPAIPFSDAEWRTAMADFMEQIRNALPNGVEIVHDVLWTAGDANPDVLRELRAADWVSLERGFDDPSIIFGGGLTGWQTLAAWVERRGAVYFSAAASRYGLASYLMVATAASAMAPGWEWLDIGAPLGARHLTGNVWRRDYEGGIVLVNEPYRPTRTVNVPAGYRDLDGVARTSVRLRGGAGEVLTPIPTPSPTPTPTPSATPPHEPTSSPAPPPAPAKAPPPPRARISKIGSRGARGPKATRTSVRASAVKLSGKVSGAAGGAVRLVIERRRASRWAVVRRVAASVHRRGTFSLQIRRLTHGRYRVRGSFQGTGTSRPSRSAYRTFRA